MDELELELLNTQLDLINHKMMVLQLQGHELKVQIDAKRALIAQRKFDASVDEHDSPSGATVQDDNLRGS